MTTIDEIRKSACVVPILNVSNLETSFDYYVNKLQFTKEWDWGEPKSFGCVSFGPLELFLCAGGQGSPGTWMSIFVDDIDAYAEIIRNAGADIVYGPVDEVWNVREIHVRDPDGHIIRFGSNIEHDED
jgi:catechol 2,3-dioxygenase-like lactoylglutathione lyase family enzyme